MINGVKNYTHGMLHDYTASILKDFMKTYWRTEWSKTELIWYQLVLETPRIHTQYNKGIPNTTWVSVETYIFSELLLEQFT